MTEPENTSSAPSTSSSTPSESGTSTSTWAPRIAAVIVTRNRLALLQESVAAVRAQTRALDEIIVVDNGSDDGTREWLESQEGLTVIRQGNLGGAGGFWRGMKEGHARGHDWVWCMDDDTIATPTALEKLCASTPFLEPGTGYLASLVEWTDGTPHRMNMWYSVPGNVKEVGWYASVLRERVVPCQNSTFVSILISARAIEAVGLPIKEMFIWCDDVEYTQRISSSGLRCYFVLDSVAVHKTAANRDGSLDSITPGDYFKLRYGLRNELYFRRLQSRHQRITRPLRLGLFLFQKTLALLRARAPWFLMRALWSGLFFNPRIERVAPRKRS